MTRLPRRSKRSRHPECWHGLEALEGRALLSAVAPQADDLPVISLTSNNITLNEDGETAVLEFSRSGSTAAELTVFYSVDGTANTDVTSAPLNFASGQQTVRVTVSAVDDDLIEGEETVIVTIDANDLYIVDDNATVTLIVGDNDNPQGLPIITVTGPSEPISELGAAAGFVLTRTSPLTTPLTVEYTIAGTATPGADYVALSGTVTFASGSSQAIITLQALPDDLVEVDETVQITLDFGNDYVVGQSATATATIVDGVIDPGLPLVQVTADPIAQEGGPGSVVTFTRGGSTEDPLTIFFAVDGSAIEGQDYQALPRQVTIAAGETSASITLTPIDDDQGECAELIHITLQGNEEYRLPAQDFATILLRDDDLFQDVPSEVIVLGDGGAKSILFTDADGTLATLKLTRGSAAVQILGDNITVIQDKKGAIVNGSNLRIGAIDITQSDLRTALKVKTNGGDGRITAGRIRSEGSVKQISAKTLDLGCELFIDGQIKKLDLGSTAALGNSTIWITGSGLDPRITFDQVQDLTLITGSAIKQLRANTWLSTANGINRIVAPSAGKVQIKGDFAADMNLTDASAAESLKALKVTGDIEGSTLRAASSVKQVIANSLRDSALLVGMDGSAILGALPSSTAQFVNTSAQLGKLKLRGVGQTMTNSLLAAWSLGQVDLREVQTDNGGAPLGVAAGQFKRLAYLVDGQAVRLAPVSGTPVLEQHGDFVVRQVGGGV